MQPSASSLPTAVMAGSAATTTVQNCRILLVEDERAFQDLLESFLRSLGCTVETASDGRRAVQLVQTQRFDVVLTDLCMPTFDGMELIRHLRQSHGTVPIIAMSGGVAGQMAGMLKAAQLLGARRTLMKPFPLAELAEAVRSVLAPSR